MPILDSVFSQVFRSVMSVNSEIPKSLFAQAEQGFWYDPSDLTTLFQDNLGATPVTAAGQTVGRMLDKSGRGNHATQATLAQRPTYQIDGTGRPYLSFDGVDDSMVTGTITPAIDKLQVFAGVSKLSDVAAGVVAELSASRGANAGSFSLFAPSGGTTAYYLASRGSIDPQFNTNNGPYPAPTTNVVGGVSDIAGPFRSTRVNGLAVTSTDTLGTGNFLAYPVYIGRRGGASLPFNGRIYSLIVRFGANLTDAQITSTESYVNAKTGAY